MSECSLISQPLILISASGVAIKPLRPCMLGRLCALILIICNRVVTELAILPNDVHFTYSALN